MNMVFLQSLMIASIPNIIGWLAISFAKVSIFLWSKASNNACADI